MSAPTPVCSPAMTCHSLPGLSRMPLTRATRPDFASESKATPADAVPEELEYAAPVEITVAELGCAGAGDGAAVPKRAPQAPQKIALLDTACWHFGQFMFSSPCSSGNLSSASGRKDSRRYRMLAFNKIFTSS